MKGRSCLPNDPKLSPVYVLANSGFVLRRCPMAESQVILGLLFLHIRGGCSLTILLFSLMLFQFGRYPMFHTLTSVGRKNVQCAKRTFAFRA